MEEPQNTLPLPTAHGVFRILKAKQHLSLATIEQLGRIELGMDASRVYESDRPTNGIGMNWVSLLICSA